MRNENKVLACVDQSRIADCVADCAAWAAKRMDAPLKFLHVITRHPEVGSGEDHSGAIGIGAQENLLSKLSEQDAVESKALHEKGRIFLNRLRERAIAAGVASPDMKQRYGIFEETLVEQEDEVRLFVLGRCGESTEASNRDLGRSVEGVVRALHKPILTVTQGFTEPHRALFAFDGSTVARKGIEMVASSPLFRSLTIHLLMSGKTSQDGAKQIEWARSALESAGFEVTPHLISSDTEKAVAETIHSQDIDMLIMGSYAHSPLRSLIFGSKTNGLLRASRIPTLLLR